MVMSWSSSHERELVRLEPALDVVCFGGSDETLAGEWIRDNMNKPVAAFIAGRTAPEGKRMGHAGAIIGGADDTAIAKMEALDSCGVLVSESPDRLGSSMAAALGLVRGPLPSWRGRGASRCD